MADEKGPGRPEFEPTSEQRKQVQTLIACKSTHDEIAGFIGITPPTLRKHFSEEIANGYFHTRAEAMLKLHTLAIEKGNVSALKELIDIVGDQPKPSHMLQPVDAVQKEEKPEKLGKKEMALLAAQEVNPDTGIGSTMARRIARLSGKTTH